MQECGKTKCLGCIFQAQENSGNYEPMVVMKKNGKKPFVVLDADYFVRLQRNYIRFSINRTLDDLELACGGTVRNL